MRCPTAMRSVVLVQTHCRARSCSSATASGPKASPRSSLACSRLAKGWICRGRLCESVHRKLPFAPPDDPVGGPAPNGVPPGRDPFSELVVPATAIRLAQWVGRAIRTEEDMAHVCCYDKRLTRTSYGRLLKGCRRLRWNNARAAVSAVKSPPVSPTTRKTPMPHRACLPQCGLENTYPMAPTTCAPIAPLNGRRWWPDAGR